MLDIDITVFVYGDAFTRFFTEISLASQLSRNNIPAMGCRADLCYHIYTTVADAETIQKTAVFKTLVSLIRVEFYIVSLTELVETVGESVYGVMSFVQKQAILNSKATYIMMLQPDIVFSDGSFTAMERRLQEGYEVILVNAQRGELESTQAVYRDMIADDGSLSIPARKMVSLLLQYPHPVTQLYTYSDDWDGKTFYSPSPSIFNWINASYGFVSYLPHLHPILVKREKGNNDFVRTIDLDYISKFEVGSDKLYFCADSDEICVAEYTKFDSHRHLFLNRAEGLEHFTDWYIDTVSLLNTWFFVQPYVFKAQDGNPEEIDAHKRETSAKIYQLINDTIGEIERRARNRHNRKKIVSQTSVKRIALFADKDFVYMNMLSGLKRGFNDLGVEAIINCPYLDGPQLNAFIDEYRPDALFEIDRFRDQIEDFRGDIPHIAWYQNHVLANGRRVNENATGSDLVYCCADPIQYGLKPGVAAQSRVLLTGVDPYRFFPDNQPAPYDIAMLGYIHSPLDSKDFLTKMVNIHGRDVCSLSDMAAAFFARGLYHHTNFSLVGIKSFIRDFLEDCGATISIDAIPRDLSGFFDDYLIRTTHRRMMAESMLRVSNNSVIYGHGSWKDWSMFAPYYKKPLIKASELADGYRSARIIIHQGTLSLHFRSLEGMACGRTVLVNHSVLDGTKYGIDAYFEPEEHYIPYDFDQFEEIAAQAVKDRDRCDRISKAATKRVLEGHTWRHRAQQILTDLAAG